MKRVVAFLTVVCLLFSTYVASFAECSHEHLEMTYDPIIHVEYLDETYHTVQATVYNRCRDCGEEVIYTSDMGTAYHSYSNGVCECKAIEPAEEEMNRPCTHQNLKMQYDPYYVYEYKDEKYHYVSVELYYQCKDCGETIVKYEDYGKERHSYSRGVCTCEAIEPTPEPTLEPTSIPTEVVTPETAVCLHRNLVEKYSPEYQYDYVNEEYHHVTVTLYYECKECGEEIIQYADYGLQNHFFLNAPCACGYVEPVVTPKPTVYITPVPTVYITPEVMITNTPVITLAPTPTVVITPLNITPQPTITALPTIQVKVTTKSPTFTPYVTFKTDKPIANQEEIVYAGERIGELKKLADVFEIANKNGDILVGDVASYSELWERIRKLEEVQNGTSRLSEVREFPKIDEMRSSQAITLLKDLDIPISLTTEQAVAYYQFEHDLEVTGWITQETYSSIVDRSKWRKEVSEVYSDAKSWSAIKLINAIEQNVEIMAASTSPKVKDDIYEAVNLLVKYLKQTKEYKNNISIKDVDWLAKVGDGTPSFRQIVDNSFTKNNIYSARVGTSAKDYLKGYGQDVLADSIILADGVILFGGAASVALEVATTSGLAITAGGTTVVTITGYTAEQWTQAVDEAINSVADNKINHIMQEKHLWSQLVSTPTFESISVYLQKVLLYGEQYTLERTNMPYKEMAVDGFVVRVFYNVIDGVLTIVDAYVVR